MGAVWSRAWWPRQTRAGRWTALSATERRLLQELGYPTPRLEDLMRTSLMGPPEALQQLQEETSEGKSGTGAETTATPAADDLQGVIGTQEWMKFASRVLSAGNPVVVHSVIFPKDRDPRSMRLDSCSIREEQRTRYPPGVIPETDLIKSPMFEVYSQEDCLPLDGFRANHFVVLNAEHHIV
eukprot:Gregarina_sp_Poly_1__194@NODE_1045_length_5261_cov_14_130920_g725_i0_p5_GENE_NODE_1045_length_5261_cov_14_130920_g725_i0NODE_1045_length_5261_cov_14_130920_g725_i0_p5_ORF_typecomplete_len182_score28_56_NODE_1045_length_5261_cov_14_130920_g725_i024953040